MQFASDGIGMWSRFPTCPRISAGQVGNLPHGSQFQELIRLGRAVSDIERDVFAALIVGIDDDCA